MTGWLSKFQIVVYTIEAKHMVALKQGSYLYLKVMELRKSLDTYQRRLLYIDN